MERLFYFCLQYKSTMFGMSGGEIVIILLIVLVFFGSKSMPKIARTLGRGMRQIKDATQDIQRDIQDSVMAVSYTHLTLPTTPYV